MTDHPALVTLFAVGVLLNGAVTAAAAHDSRTVGGYGVTFGGADEPLVTDERMWLEVEVVDAETGEPVEGLDESLTIAVQQPFGNDTRELELDSRFGEPGWYEAPIVFTEPGTYTVFLNGSIDGTAADLSFQKKVHDARTLEYPARTETGDAGDAGPLTGTTGGIAVGVGLAVLGMGLAFAAGRRL